ncbi:MAG: sugar phosphate isomerase/epimerase family protein [Christensenella sp.]|uniref:sugar phosphate isomerase/epimerase family protein n=1 Tax=Christensenella sp. TaxID=1935934 RepID=UPI002B211A4B|nr:sugar phosphate isomerase/epimerase family protein [Christensenella sp.]MEA5001876.1 sugar phosphate isomerase/epimerase family protein [Christensenella sp.]
MKKSQLALSNYPYYKHSTQYTLASMQKLGANAIELYCCEPHFHIDDVKLPEVAAMKNQLKKRNMFPICLTPEQVKYPINIAATNPFARKRSIETYVKVLQCAHELESPTVQFHAGYALLDENRDIVWQRSLESLTYLSRIAEGYGITIVMESAHRLCTILNSSADVEKMVKQVDSPNLKGMIDTLCLIYCSEDIDTAIKNIGVEDLRHIHFSDCYVEKPKEHLVPGEGTMDLDHVIDALDKIDYKGYITLELLSPHEYNPERATKAGADWLRARLSD